MTYLGSDRFVVRELEGFSKAMYGGSDSWPGLCITVIDRAYCCQVLRMWQTEEHHTGGNGPKTMTRDRLRGTLRAEAAEFCAALNTRVAGVQAGQSPRRSLS